ncbi:MAG: hypothetical protein JSR58_05240 [Verrucomicrobia bacterium]|nr:hypothetical protein [Verrucomicrobiota bacterium]
MKISIAQRLRPFSRLPGTSCLVPGTAWQVTAFPTQLKFHNLLTDEEREESIAATESFTLTQDLERGEVVISGKKYKHVVKLGSLPASIERLSLGSHKTLDWDMSRRRLDLSDILPVWFRLGQMVPADGKIDFPEMDKLEVVPFLKNVFRAYFQGILVPRLFDDDHQGLFPEGKPIATGSLALLHEGARWIRGLFFQEGFHFLPHLPPEFHAGRLLHLKTKEGDDIDMEWSKKLLRRVVIRPGKSRSVKLHLQKPLASFRIRRGMKDRGERLTVQDAVEMVEGQVLLFDRFEK